MGKIYERIKAKTHRPENGFQCVAPGTYLSTRFVEGQKVSVLSVHGDITEKLWTADDRYWFEFNPDRNFRLRRSYPQEEFAKQVSHRLISRQYREAWVLVNQIEPGQRQRIPVFVNEDLSRILPRLAKSEGALSLLLEYFHSKEHFDSGVVRELLRRAGE